MEDFKKELTTLINRHSIENEWDMPDFLMAQVICQFIESVGPTFKKALDWHGVDSVCHPKIKSRLEPFPPDPELSKLLPPDED